MKVRVLPVEEGLEPKFRIIAENTEDEVFLKQLSGMYGDGSVSLQDVVFNGDGVSSLVVIGEALPQPPDQQCNCDTLYNADGSIDGVDRLVELLNDASLRIRQAGVHSFQLGADVPAGMLPIPDLKFSGLTGSKATDGLMTLNGTLYDPNGNFIFEDIYTPIQAIFEGNGDIHYSAIGKSLPSLGGFSSIINGYSGLSDFFIEFFREANRYLYDVNANEIKWQLGKDGSISHTGAYANKPTRYTAGGNHTIPDNVSVYIYDPASVQAGATITLPANPLDGQDLYIFGGGTITSGNVITGFTLDGNGRTIIGDGASALKVGKAYELHYCGDNNIWYAIAF